MPAEIERLQGEWQHMKLILNPSAIFNLNITEGFN
jgi:hypothetical protein